MSRDSRESPSDDALIDACNRGDADAARIAFGVLYERHKRYVLRIAMRFTDDRELAADALQEVFSYVLKQFPPPGPGLTLTARFSTYLYPIVRNSTLTLLRKARRMNVTMTEPDALAADPPADGDDLDRLLAGLSPERREILTLRFVDGMALDDIATVLAIPLGTVKSRLHLAIKALREHPAAQEFFDK